MIFNYTIISLFQEPCPKQHTLLSFYLGIDQECKVSDLLSLIPASVVEKFSCTVNEAENIRKSKDNLIVEVPTTWPWFRYLDFSLQNESLLLPLPETLHMVISWTLTRYLQTYIPHLLCTHVSLLSTPRYSQGELGFTSGIVKQAKKSGCRCLRRMVLPGR